MNDADLREVLSGAYALSDVVLTPAPRGFVAETYYVDSSQGRYFAKVVKTSWDSETILRSLPVLDELYRLGIERITYPIPTISGQYSVMMDGKTLVLFNCVAGRWVFDFPFEPFVRLLGQVHQLSGQIRAAPPREIYDLSSFTASLLRHLDQLWSGRFHQPQEKALQDWTNARRAAIMRDYALLEQVAAQLCSTEIPFVLTHGDAPGNVLYDGKDVYLVDWDTVMFAPHERDTWFHRYDDGFLPLYREFVPGYEFDPIVCRFYLYRRYFEDMEGFFEKVLSPDSSDEQKTHNLNELYQDCDDWLGSLMELDRAGTRP